MGDLLCADYGRAARNRQRVRLKQNIEAYLRVEVYLRTHPRRAILPDWIPQGKIPTLNPRQGQRAFGMHELDWEADDGEKT